MFKAYRVEVENQLNKRIKYVEFDCGGEQNSIYYRSRKQHPKPFTKFLEECEIIP